MKKAVHLNVANETMEPVHVTVRWALRNTKGEALWSREADMDVPALSSEWLPKEELLEAGLYENYVSYECIRDGALVSEGTVLFCPPKQFHFENPKLSV